MRTFLSVDSDKLQLRPDTIKEAFTLGLELKEMQKRGIEVESRIEDNQSIVVLIDLKRRSKKTSSDV